MRHRRSHLHQHANLGEKIADQVASSMGSWGFIIGQAVFLALWFVLNTVGWFFHWDSYPFILANLFMSAEAAFASPLILMSQNRQAARDRKRDDLEAQEVDGMFANNELLLKINQQQLEILQLLRPQERLEGISPLVNPKMRYRKPERGGVSNG